jgi:ribonuclease HI
MKSTRYILVDSSTKASGKWGKSAVCWAFFYPLCRTPDKVGLLYSPNEGPNRMFFWGVIAGLEYCINSDEIYYKLVVRGDCKCAINVLNRTSGRDKLSRFYDIAKRLEERLKSEKQVDVSYEYIPRTEKEYQGVDRCAKQAANFIEQRFGIK